MLYTINYLFKYDVNELYNLYCKYFISCYIIPQVLYCTVQFKTNFKPCNSNCRLFDALEMIQDKNHSKRL